MAIHDDEAPAAYDPDLGRQSRSCGCVSDDDQFRLRLALEDASARRSLALAAEDRAEVRTHSIAAQKLRWKLAEAIARAEGYEHTRECAHRPASIRAAVM